MIRTRRRPTRLSINTVGDLAIRGISIAALLVYMQIAALAQVGPRPGMGPLLFGKPSIGAPTTIVTSTKTINSGSSFTVTTTSAISAGSLVACSIIINSTGGAKLTGSPSDGTNSYSLAVSNTTTFTQVGIWYNASPSAVSSGATLTVNTSGSFSSGDGIAVHCDQIPGIITTSPVDQTATNSNGGNASCTATTSSLGRSNEIALGSAVQANQYKTYLGASGFSNSSNQQIPLTDGVAVSDYQTVASTSAVSYTPTWNTSNNSATNCAVATFKGY